MATTTERGILLPCPLCGEKDATLHLSLGDGDTVKCGECDNEFSLDVVREIIQRWPAVLKWIDAMPVA